MSAPTPLTGSALLRRRLSGVVFLVVLAMLVTLTVLLYQKAFTPVVRVSLKTDRIGNQMSTRADVKLRGLVVGTVRSIHATAEGATLDLALDPAQVGLIPDNVVAQLLPKTLFGEKYVELSLPPAPSTQHLRAGDVIPQDRSATAMETERVLNDLLPLLRSIQPQSLSLALNALSSALRGRGDKFGANLVTAGAYFTKFNPSIPRLGHDMQGLADFADTVNAASPDLLTALDNLSASSRNLVQERHDLDAFLTSTTGFAASARSIVAQNERSLKALAKDSLPSLTLYKNYSAEFPCWLKGLALYEPIVARTFGGAQPGLHITVEGTTDNGGFAPGQEPKYRDTRGPSCWKLPHPTVPEGNDKFDDGYQSSTTPSPSLTALLQGPMAGAGVGQR